MIKRYTNLKPLALRLYCDLTTGSRETPIGELFLYSTAGSTTCDGEYVSKVDYGHSTYLLQRVHSEEALRVVALPMQIPLEALNISEGYHSMYTHVGPKELELLNAALALQAPSNLDDLRDQLIKGDK